MRLRPRRPAEAGDPSPVTGIVEEFSRRLVRGWVSVPADAAPTRVTLHLGKLQLSATYATEEAESVGTAGKQRRSPQQIRTFAFRVRGIWAYVSTSTRITVRVDGRPLPINGHGMFLRPRRNGEHDVPTLRALMEEGHVLNQFGNVSLSKKLDVVWQETVMGLYARTRRVVADAFGHDVFFVYGTLLGAVREGGYIAHDPDFDAAYVSRHRTGPEAAAELQEIALALIAAGLDVECRAATLHVEDPDQPGLRIDLFHTWFDGDGLLRFPFGVAGTTQVHERDWQGCHEIDFPGGRGLVPVIAEQLVEHLYGAEWRRPKPGFNWNLDRTDSAPEGLVPVALRTKVYWANFYSRNSYSSGSTFFTFVDAREDTPGTIIDIGCGDGRDGCAFGVAGRTVLGLDQSPVGIEHATARAAQLGLADRVRFEVCDVADVDDLGRALDLAEDGAGGPVMFYLRFFLHAIPEDVQQRLLAAIDTHARPGDLFAAEFRTDKDEATSHVHTRHYRRFQSAAAFRAALTGIGFTLLHEEEGTGLSPYQGEDPVLYRVVARR